MESMKGMKKGKMGNKGFSLIEMIIVIAVMAVLIGLVGMQVTPYLNKARVAKDMQIINSYCTAAVTLYTSKADNFAKAEQGGRKLTVHVYNPGGSSGDSFVNGDDGVKNYPLADFCNDIKTLTGYARSDLLADAMSSADGKDITDVIIRFNFQEGIITAQAVKGSDYNTRIESFDLVESRISGGK